MPASLYPPPAQVDCRHLTRLRLLHLTLCLAEADEYEPLTSLPALERLVLVSCLQLPACLGRLPALRLLSLINSPILEHKPHDSEAEYEEEQAPPSAELQSLQAAALRRALSALSAARLTQLELHTHYPVGCSQELARLNGLQALQARLASGSAPLPAGAWLRSLRWAVLSWDVAAAALPALAAATQLEGLAIQSLAYLRTDNLAEEQPFLLAVLAWAPQHRSLRLLEVEFRGETRQAGESNPAVRAAMQQAQQAAPALRVQFGSQVSGQLDAPTTLPSMAEYA